MDDKPKEGLGGEARALASPYGPQIIPATLTDDLFADIPVQGPPGTSNQFLNEYYNNTIQGRLLNLLLGSKYGAPKRQMPK